VTTITDDFNRANAGDLGANWFDVHGNGLQIVSNAASNSADGSYDGSLHNTPLATDDHRVEVVINLKHALSYWDIKLRHNGLTGASSDGYKVSVGGSNERYLTRVDNGTGTDIDSGTVTFATGDTLGGQIEGTTITGDINGGSQWSDIDATYSAGKHVGLGMYRTSTVSTFDNFSAEDLGAAVTSFLPRRSNIATLLQM
jgi:hypothetical protein